MRDLAPGIVRQRLLVEGFFTVRLDGEAVAGYLTGIAAHLGLKAYGPPQVHSPQGLGMAQNAGFDAFMPLVDSGISLYVWSAQAFFAAVLFTCKRFEVQSALAFTRDYFGSAELSSASSDKPDPIGAARVCWAILPVPPLSVTAMIQGLRTVIYPVSELGPAKAWYTRVLGVEPCFDEAYYVGYAVGGFELGLIPDGIPGAQGAVGLLGGRRCGCRGNPDRRDRA